MPREESQMRKVSSCLVTLSVIFLCQGIRPNPIAGPGVVLAPRWARDLSNNPCASLGWQMVLWPTDSRCYQVFRRGPCPEGQELAVDTKGKPHCRCPPGQLRVPEVSSNTCYAAHHRGPCPHNHYLQPAGIHSDLGKCVTATKICTPEKPLLWPPSNQCYELEHPPARGPCAWGELLLQDPENGALGHCACDHNTAGYHEPTRSCHQLFTRGPCVKGQILLPNGICGCHKHLKQYYAPKLACYTLGEQGPCEYGEKLVYHFHTQSPKCECDADRLHVNGIKRGCWKVLSRGPCPRGFVVTKGMGGVGICEPEPCPQGLLLHLVSGTCHPPGAEHPCPRGQKLLFTDSDPGDVSILGSCACPTSKECTDKENVMIQNSTTNEKESIQRNRTRRLYFSDGMEKPVQNLHKNNVNITTYITEHNSYKIYHSDLHHHHHHHPNHRYKLESRLSSHNIRSNKSNAEETVSQNPGTTVHQGVSNKHITYAAATNTQFDTSQILADIRKQFVLTPGETHTHRENNGYESKQIFSDIQSHLSNMALSKY